MSNRLKLNIVSLLLLAFVAACGGGGGGGEPEPVDRITYTYTVPQDVGDGWQTANIADEGFDTELIGRMMNKILTGTYIGIDSIAIVRNNKLVLLLVCAARIHRVRRLGW